MHTRAVLLLLGFVALGCRKVPEPILQLQTYADLRHKVSFEYPAPWALTRPLTTYLAAPDLGLEHPPSAVISVTRDDEPRLRGSDFQAAEFVYAVRTGLSDAACAAIAGPMTAEVGGTRFHTREGGNAGMMHTRDDHVYSILHGPNCFLFDLALLRTATDATRPMTDREQGDLQTELMQILASVSLQ